MMCGLLQWGANGQGTTADLTSKCCLACASQAAHEFAEGVKRIDGLEVVGKPDMCVVAIKSISKQLNIYKVNDLMSQRGWHLNALQFPSSVHMCFTAQHTKVVPELLQVIKRAL